MYAAELFKWPPPRSTVLTGNNKDFVNKTIYDQFFNYSVSIVAPDALAPPEEIVNAFTRDTTYYHIAHLPVHELLHPQFVEPFINQGALTLMSVGTHIDQDNCLALSPTGHIVLSLVKESFQELGLEGVKSRFTDDRFVVTLNLKDGSFLPGKKLYDRTYERLKALGLKFNVIAAWDPTDLKICPSNLAAWFHENHLTVRKCTIASERRTEFNVSVPDLKEGDEADVGDVLEWAGMLLLGCKMHNMSDSEKAISLYEVPEPNRTFGQVSLCQWSGLFTSRKLHSAILQLSEWAESRDSAAWVLVTVNGFDDAVVTRGHQEHSLYTEGDHGYSILFRKSLPPLTVSYVNSSEPPRRTFVTRGNKRKNRSNEKRSKRLKVKKRR